MHRHRRHDPQPPRHPSRGHPYQQANAWWSDRAAYAPGYPIYDFHAPAYPRQYEHLPRQHVSRPPDLGPTNFPQRSPQAPRVRVNIPKRQVHFELPTHSLGHGQQARRPSRPDLKRTSTPANPARNPSQPDHKRPSHPDLRRQPSHHNLPCESPLRPPPKRPPPRSDKPTIHILTYAIKQTPNHASALRLLTEFLPPGIPHLYTIHAFNFTPPPEHLCLNYSGVSSIIQEHVMRDPRARKAVRQAVDELLWFARREKKREIEGRGKARKDVALSVCCEYGTHRSVSVAERIAKEIEELRLGARVRVVHVHRRRGEKDPY